jgi:hypothetical protein
MMGNTSVRQDPNSYQALMAKEGSPLLSDLTDANGNKLGNPALALGKIVATAPVKTAMILGGPAEEETLLSAANGAMNGKSVAYAADTAGQSLWSASRASRGFKSFEQLKKFLGSPGEGNEWHHIVEQNPFNIAKFGPEAVHNVDNVVPISAELNQKLNAFYQTKNELTGGLAPREWLRDKTLQQNYDFGVWALQKLSQ